jgi:O-antigen/teichoic acid export membrane protein
LGTYAFLPPFREAFERGERDWVRVNFKRMVFLRMAIATAASLVFLLAGNPVLRLWLHSGSVVFTTIVRAATGILLISATWVTAYSDLLQIMDKIWVLTSTVLVNGVVTTLLTFYLSPVFGVLGAIAALGFVTVAVWTWLMPIIASALLRLSSCNVPPE